jgi:glutathione S-transferase
MQLYFSPLACSLATRIALYEAGAGATFSQVDSKTKRTLQGEAFLEINPLGLVPTLRSDTGEVLTENAAILQYVAEQFPEAQLAPTHGMPRTRLQQWLCFIGTELHKALFVPLLDPHAPEHAKRYALDHGAPRLALLERHLQGRDFLLDQFSVADAYLVTVLNWSLATPVTYTEYPALQAYIARVRARPHVARAFAEERQLYAQAHART